VAFSVAVAIACAPDDERGNQDGASPGVGDTASPNADLVAATERVLEFLRSEIDFDSALFAPTVILYVAPEGGGQERSLTRNMLADRNQWRVQDHSFLPPEGLTDLSISEGQHFNCLPVPLASRDSVLASRPHVGIRLADPQLQSCLQTWSLTLIFSHDTLAPQVTGVLYDQWEW
jgi:hypothetical protein